MSFLKTMKHLLGLDEPEVTQVNASNPLRNRVSIEARELDFIIGYLQGVRNKLEYTEYIRAEDIKVVSPDVIKEAEHAKLLGEIKKKAKSADDFIKTMTKVVKRAGERGFYAGRTYFIEVATYEVTEQSHLDHNGRFNKLGYYTALLDTVYMYVAIREMQNRGYKIRVRPSGHDFYIITNDTVPDELLIVQDELEDLKSAEPVDKLLDAYVTNAKKLYAEFPELFSNDLKRELGI
jgi:hypothetical protein